VFYTYAHYTPENRLFYIGKGHGRRAYTFSKRNNYWNHIVEKFGKPRVEILADWNTEKEAFEHEMLLISCFKDMGYRLVNLSNGGEGPSGLKHSEEFKEKIRKLHTGSAYNLGRPTSAKQKAIASKLSKNNIYAAGNTNNRKWVWVGTNVITGEVVKFIGEKEMKAAGIQHSNVIKCLNGQRKSHKGYTWHRELWENKSWH
jgi:hypothetical protein